MTAPAQPPLDARLHARISAADLERVKEAYYARAGKHRLSFSAWIVAVLLEKAERTLGKLTKPDGRS